MTSGEMTVEGLHSHLFTHVIPPPAARGARALDLGTGTGAVARSLLRRGYEVTTCDRAVEPIDGVATHAIDLDVDDWCAVTGTGFDIVLAIEVIEHLENPQGFLRQIARVLRSDGLAIVTSPRFESAAARLQFMRRATLRLMDRNGDPTHISPIFRDLMARQYAPRAGLTLAQTAIYPERGSMAMRPLNQSVSKALARLRWIRELVSGDVNIFLLTLAA